VRIELKKVCSYAEKNGWILDFFDDRSILVSRLTDRDSRKKTILLQQYAEHLRVKTEIEPCDDLVVLKAF